jgi:uncharacterized protein YukE
LLQNGVSVNPEFERLARLIENVSQSLHREMHEGFSSQFDGVNSRLDRIEALLDRQCSDLESAFKSSDSAGG